MGRWEPGSKDRLQEAAFALFAEQGYDRTTVAEIAERAGVTERTFFRHYPDKKDVLFAGAEVFEGAVVEAVRAAPAEVSPLAAALAGTEAGLGLIAGFRGRDAARQRWSIIDSSPELRERELIKLATLTRAIAAALAERGSSPGEAGLAAELAVTVFSTTFARWLATDGDPAALQRETLAELRALAA